jgi:hypothetical protein
VEAEQRTQEAVETETAELVDLAAVEKATTTIGMADKAKVLRI